MLDFSAVNRPLLAVAGLCGAIGVGLAAGASHSGAANLGIAASFLQLHAPALIGISLLAANRLATAAGWALVAGLVLFAGDLVLRVLVQTEPFGIPAPLGGFALIAGWLLLAAAALFGGRRSGAAP